MALYGRIRTDRPAYDSLTCDTEFGYVEPIPLSYRDRIHNQLGCRRWAAKIVNFFPILRWMSNYKFREHILSDLIAGLTVALIHIPQGLAYAQVANVEGKVGLYTSFFPILVYLIFGTSRHVSQGTFAVIALMVSASSKKLEDQWHITCMEKYNKQPQMSSLTHQTTTTTTTTTPFTTTNTNIIDDNSTDYIGDIMSINASGLIDDMMALSSSSTTNGPLITTTLLESNTTLDYIAQSANDHCTKIRPQRLYIVTALTMMVGICQIVMGICRLDFITNFLSDQVIAGFTCGSAVHVFSTQIHYFFNCNSSICKVSAWEQNKNFFIVHVYWEIVQGVAAMNGTAWMILAFSFATMLILVVGKEFVNSAVRKRMRIPLPWELVLVIIATSISKSADFDSQGVSVVEHMDAGFEPPRIPIEMSDLSFDMLLLESLNIAVVIFAINVSLAKVFAKKHGYKIDAKQELFALGLMQIIGSIFHCFAASPALARSSVYEHAGARTQVAAIFTSIIMFIVIQWLIPYLQGLPMCVLAAIIIVALKGMFLQIKQLPQLWNLSKLDFCTWLVTFCLTVFLGVSRALLYSAIFAMFTAVARQQISQSSILRRLIDTDIFLEEKYYKKVDHSRQNLIIFRYNAPLIFANVEHFKSQLMETIEQFINSNTVSAYCIEHDSYYSYNFFIIKYVHEPSHNNGTSIPMIRPTMRRSVAFRKFVVMDCSAISYCDTMGLTALNEAFIDVSLAGVRPIFACLNCEVRKQLSLTSFWQKVSQEAVFPTINDAIAYLED